MSGHSAEKDAPVISGDRIVECSCHMVSGVHDERVPREGARVAPSTDAGCPSCGGDNLAACAGSVWCNECEWIDPPERVIPSAVDGDQ